MAEQTGRFFYDDCAACGHPQDGHGTRYAAVAGDHTYVPEIWGGPTTETGDAPIVSPEWPPATSQLRVCTETDPCVFCGPVSRWIRDTDPDPAPPPGNRIPTRKATT